MAPFHPHYLTFTPQTYHHPVHRFRSWSLASSTSINKLQVMQNTALRTATRHNIQHLHDGTLTLPIHEHLQLHASQYKHKTQHPSHPHHKHTTYFNTPRLKNTIFNNGRFTTNIPTDPHTVTTTDITTNMRHIHTSIVSRHLATRGNNKILHTLAALKIDFPASLVAPLPNSEQTNLPSSNPTYTKLTPKHIHHHYAPSVTSTHTPHIISSTAPTYAPQCHPWICGQTPPEWLHCWPDGRSSWLVDHKREHLTPPTSKGHGIV